MLLEGLRADWCLYPTEEGDDRGAVGSCIGLKLKSRI